jgi:endonuclease YncB( thermonuclease family)
MTLRKERIRLAAIDCPELRTPEGRAARDFVYARLMSAKTIAIHSERNRDLHGRYVAHLYYSPDNIRITNCITQATHLNAELLATGHAERVV